MKKLALLAVPFLATTVFAQSTGWYTQLDVGVSKMSLKSEGSTTKKNDLNQRISVGYDFGNYRVAADYTNHAKIKETATNETGVYKSEIKPYSVGVTGFYDFNVGGDVTPYVGVRLSHNLVKAKHSEDTKVVTPNGSLTSSESSSATETKIGFGGLVGLDYKLTDAISLNAVAEYDNMGKMDDVKLNNFGVKAGLRYSF